VVFRGLIEVSLDEDELPHAATVRASVAAMARGRNVIEPAYESPFGFDTPNLTPELFDDCLTRAETQIKWGVQCITGLSLTACEWAHTECFQAMQKPLRE
jgi:hypothetical protein